ncbi:hypothetical protein HS141_11460 [Cetobacterium somerae]|uniref:hypothetical protein n=1 Tax=Cetobacterium somerae TaxID=188913 RepID=UPI00211DA56F|nr:hypothetical protein [Cetobacterium somerae]MCQ9627544.1 hypothetical protein [Cetobacterium somerae]
MSSNVFEKYNIPIPKRDITEFQEEDVTKILTFKVGVMVPRVLRELDKFIDKKNQLSARQASLIYNGKNDKRENYRMENYVGKYGKFFTDIELNIKIALEDILEQVISDMANYDKNANRKEKFFNTVDSVPGQVFIFIIGTISIGQYMLDRYGYIKNGRYLEQVLLAKEDLANKSKQIFKDTNRGKYTYEEATEIFKKLIDEKIQKQMKFDIELYEEIKFENDLFNLCTEESLNDLVYQLVDGARQKVTNQMRLIELNEF